MGNNIVIIVAIAVGLVSAWLPDPVGSKAHYVVFLGLLALIVAGHRAAFRADDAGVFAFWKKPIKMAAAPVNAGDAWLVKIGLALVLAPLVSMGARAVLT